MNISRNTILSWCSNSIYEFYYYIKETLVVPCHKLHYYLSQKKKLHYYLEADKEVNLKPKVVLSKNWKMKKLGPKYI